MAPNPMLQELYVDRAGKLQRGFLAAYDALERHIGRGKPQRVLVEHVTVAAGGQAIVGVVDARRGGGNGGEGGKL